MAQDWFEQHAPAQDWFEQNAPGKVKPFKLPEIAGNKAALEQGAVGFGSAAIDDLRAAGQGIKSFWAKPLREKFADLVFSPLTLGEGAVSGLGQAEQRAENVARQPGLSPISKAGKIADIAIGGSPEEASKLESLGQTGAAAWAAIGRPAAQAAVGEGIARALPVVGSMAEGTPLRNLPGAFRDVEQPELFTRTNRSNLAELIQKDMPEANVMEAGGVVDRQMSSLRQAAKSLGWTEKDLDSLFPSKQFEISHPFKSARESRLEPARFRVERGVENRARLFDANERIYGNQFDTLVREYNGHVLDPRRVASKVSGHISDAEAVVSPELAKKLNAVAQEISDSSFKSLGDMDKLRKEFNKRADKAYAAIQKGTDPGVDLDTLDAYRRAADVIRDAEYDQLGYLSGLPSDQIRQLQQLHGDAVKMKFANQDNTLRTTLTQAQKQNRYLQRVFTGRSEERTPTSRSMVARAFMGGPQGELNVAARRALRGFEQAGTPQRILPEMRGETIGRQLPYPAVEIPTELQKVIETPHKAMQNATYRYIYPVEFNPPVPAPDSTITGVAAGTMQVTTPEQAREMLESMSHADFSGLDAQTKAKARDTIDQLSRLAQTGESGPPPRRMKVEPGTSGSRTVRRKRNLPTVRRVIGQGISHQLPTVNAGDQQ